MPGTPCQVSDRTPPPPHTHTHSHTHTHTHTRTQELRKFSSHLDVQLSEFCGAGLRSTHFFNVFAVSYAKTGSPGLVRLIFIFDLLIADAMSLSIVTSELSTLYANAPPSTEQATATAVTAATTTTTATAVADGSGLSATAQDTAATVLAHMAATKGTAHQMQ